MTIKYGEKILLFFEVQSYSKFSREKFGPFRSSVVKSWVVRSWVFRSCTVRSWVVRSSVVLSWVVRSSVVQSSVGESLICCFHYLLTHLLCLFAYNKKIAVIPCLFADFYQYSVSIIRKHACSGNIINIILVCRSDWYPDFFAIVVVE